MTFDDEREEAAFETTDGDVYWAEDGANYIGSAGKVVLSCRDSDGQETSDTFLPSEAVGLAVELARAAGVHESTVEWLGRRMRWLMVQELTADFSGMGLEDVDKVAYRMFGVDLLHGSLSIPEVRSVIAAFRKEQLDVERES